ncbi:Golgi transport complex subunit 5-domain-containing protein [Halteromyces radiatus]|uniref:Golgi transport complex subunit 5-domain-containing protein n=1 Tax=Halteromyces radiatus TaxID=101107 RepID=UPI0022210A5D|nr:Golgi transport complex subunit 5-domain-containing protein [Halteromyces radiatus]KAI8097718.1 Golgi transport complex subunit 5-domain-containing protein [Halteromyces radiatus]
MNYEALLDQVTGIKELDIVLSTVQDNITVLNTSLSRLSLKIRTPYEQLETYTTQLRNLQTTCDLLRRLHRFIVLFKRLSSQYSGPMEKKALDDSSKETMNERDITAAATTIHELGIIIDESDFDGIDIVTKESPMIQQCRERIIQEGDRLLNQGIESHSQTKMAAGLQIFYNMKMMVPKVESLTQSMLDDLNNKIKHVVDMQSLQKEMKGNTPSQGPAVRRVNNEPTFGNQSPWVNTLWTKMDGLMQTMSDSCIKIYNLEKVLEIKKDSYTHVSYLDEIIKILDTSSLVSHFWRILSATFEKELKDATKASTFLQNTFVGDYPKLLRLLHGFFSRVALHRGSSISDYSQSPEYIIMLRSFSTFENGYMARSLARLNEVVNAAFPAYGGMTRSAPSRANVLTITRTIEKELETAAFEHHLLQAVAKNVVKSLNMFCVKSEGLVIPSIQSIYSVTPNNNITNYLNMNIELANVLYYMDQSVWKILEEYSEKTVDIIKHGVEDCRRLMLSIGQKLVQEIEADITNVLLQIHQEDFSGQLRRPHDQDDESSSQYTKELAKHVRYYHTFILSRLSCGTEPKSWARQIGKHILKVFIFQASLVRPLNETGKLKLAGDMAEIEFTVSQIMSEYGARIEDVGDEYKALRAFRPLLFLDSAQLTATHHTAGIPPIALIHHLVVRSQTTAHPLSLPHTVYDLSRPEYMKWMDAQTPKESVQLALDAIDRGSKMSEAELQEVPEYRFILNIANQLD